MIIKNILDKIYFHPFFYIILIISFLTGHFRNIIYFTSIILIHELGHSITGIILGMKLKRIEIYPYGGCSKLEHNINIKLWKEFFVLIMGPLIQILYLYLICFFKIEVKEYFYTYHKFILFFNLIPIYPLDGGKILNVLLSYFISFYNSLKNTYYFSYLVFFIIIFTSIIVKEKNLVYYLIIISLGSELFKELNRISLCFKKFLLERCLYNYIFKKTKKVKSVYNMKRDYYHVFIKNKLMISEKEYLNEYFKTAH